MSYRVLVADDHDSARSAVCQTLLDEGFEVEAVADGREAMAALARTDAPEIALLDWEMPGVTGIDICRTVRAQESARYTYLLLVSARRDQEDITYGLSMGADGYIAKPFDLTELIERVRAGARVIDLEVKLQQAHEQLRVEHEHRSAALEALSVTDELTGLHNRRGFVTLAEQHQRIALRRKQPFAILFIDVNGLKAINDHLGHEIGDRAIRDAAGVLKRTMRNADIIARLGGDEFVALLDGCTKATIDLVFARLKAEVDASCVDPGKPYRLSLSSGAAFFDPDEPRAIAELLSRADQQMYAKKRERRTISAPIVKGLPLSMHPQRSGSSMPVAYPSMRAQGAGPASSRFDSIIALGEHLRAAWSLRRADQGVHAERLVRYTGVLAATLGGLAQEAPMLAQLALLHDVGELAMPDALMQKGGMLDEEEQRAKRRHTVFGAELLSGIRHSFYERAARVARHHHECWNGTGYPDQLVGEACPFDARFVGIVDAYDALRHPPNGSEGFDDERIADYLWRERSRRFDPELVSGLLVALPELRDIVV